MIISVTEDHIIRGEQHDPRGCPVALAVLEHFPNAIIAAGICLRVGDAWYKLPRDVVQFEEDFDKGKWVEPFSFEIEEKVWLLGR